MTRRLAGSSALSSYVPNVKWDLLTGMGYQYLNYLDASELMGRLAA